MTELMIIGRATICSDGDHGWVGDVLVEDGKITEVGRDLTPPPNATHIAARGLDLLPGFIDVHAHDDAALFHQGALDPKLRQGVSTTVIGNCGHGCAPSVAGAELEALSSPVLGPLPSQAWPTFAAYLDQLDHDRLAINAAALVPHTPIRAAVMQMQRRTASAAEIDAMSGLFADALDAGAVGASLGLMYSPANSASIDELTAIAGTVAATGKLLVAHLRNEADRLLDSLEEFASLGRATGASLHVSHLKVTGPKNFGTMPRVVERLEALRAEGLDITADIYPYEAGSTTAATLMPPWAMDGGLPQLLSDLGRSGYRREVIAALHTSWPGSLENYYASLGPDRIVLAGFRQPANRGHDGRSLTAIASTRDQEPEDALIDLLLDEAGRLSVVLFQTDPDGIRDALAWPHTLIGSDGLPHRHGYVHPRLYGTFSKIIDGYTGPGRVLSRAEGIRRMTRDAARRFGLPGKGSIRAGQDADLQLLDPRTYRDRATYASPRESPAGVETMIINGTIADLNRGESSGRLVRSRS